MRRYIIIALLIIIGLLVITRPPDLRNCWSVLDQSGQFVCDPEYTTHWWELWRCRSETISGVEGSVRMCNLGWYTDGQ